MTEHTKTPWMTSPCGELLPDDIMIVADLGKNDSGIQLISTVARVLAIRQTREVAAANAAFIVRAVNAHDDLMAGLREMLAATDPWRDVRDTDGELDARQRAVSLIAKHGGAS